jgi:hypothetical protein
MAILLRFFKQFLAFFGIHQMALSLFRFIAALGRTEVVANTIGSFTLLMVFVLGGFIVAKGKKLVIADVNYCVHQLI